jgi:phosphate uptake regulator
MPERLFSGSWSQSWKLSIQKAVAEVERLDRQLFSDPALGGALQRIVNKYSVDVARLNTDAIVADPVEEQRVVNDVWGDRRVATIKRLRVAIPFTGEAECLRVAPSRSAIPSHAADIGKNAVSITIADDGNADREVKTFCDQVQGNLNTLRQEYERDKPQLEQAVSQAAERRKAQIATENERDVKRSFTVSR